MGNKHSKVKADNKIIVLLGPSGSGKSTFINLAMGRPVAKVSSKLACCTKKVQRVSCTVPGDSSKGVLLVDTPAFDHDRLDIHQIEDMIRNQLKDMTKRKIDITGIIYFHPITANRLTEVPKDHMGVFERLVGKYPAQRVLLATSRWEDLRGALNVGTQREQQLRHDYWKEMLEGGSRIMRFEGTENSAWDLIRAVLT
ncbi:P-loop containing nucleoside triphosphate hydrolase [Pleurotus pulmonarius]